MKYTIMVTALSLCFLTGCVASWSKSRGTLLRKKSRYKIEIATPKGWYKKKSDKTMLFTRHGLSLEYIMIQSNKWSDTLSNGLLIPKKTLLHEIPRIILGELSTSSLAFNLNIISNEIVKMNNALPCSITKYSYTSPNSLQMKGIMYCIPFKKNIAVLRYTAEKSHYYEKSYNDFVDMIATMKIRNKKYLPLPGVYGLEMFMTK